MAKEFTWKGKLEEDAGKLDMTEFMELIPSRQRRSLKRGLTEAQKSLMLRIEAGENNVKTHCRDMIILPVMVGKTLRVYNGKDHRFHVRSLFGRIFPNQKRSSAQRSRYWSYQVK